MNFDALSIAAIVISVVVAVVLLVTVHRSNERMLQRLRRVAEQSALMSPDHSTRELCTALRRMYPDTCPGIDYIVAENAAGPYIKEWYLDRPQPTSEQLHQALNREGQRSG